MQNTLPERSITKSNTPVTIAEHKGHNWYNKGHPDGSNTGDGFGIIVCKDCNERLYYGRLPIPKTQLGAAVTDDEAVANLPHGWNNRTIDDIWSLRPPHVNKLTETLIEEATAADMPKANDGDGLNTNTLSVVGDVGDVETSVADHPSGKGSSNMDSESVEVVEVGASYVLTAHFSRTIKEPGADFGSITCGYDIAETYPGEISIDRLTTLANDQFTVIKALVLTQLGLSFSMDDEGVISEAFPGAQTVARTSAQDRSGSAPASRGSGRATQAPQRGRGPGNAVRSGGGRGRASTPAAIPSEEELWVELVERPQDWYWQQEKKNPRAADFISTKYFKDDGWPVSLWETQANGTSNLPDDPEWNDAYQAIPESDFAQTLPRRRD